MASDRRGWAGGVALAVLLVASPGCFGHPAHEVSCAEAAALPRTLSSHLVPAETGNGTAILEKLLSALGDPMLASELAPPDAGAPYARMGGRAGNGSGSLELRPDGQLVSFQYATVDPHPVQAEAFLSRLLAAVAPHERFSVQADGDPARATAAQRAPDWRLAKGDVVLDVLSDEAVVASAGPDEAGGLMVRVGRIYDTQGLDLLPTATLRQDAMAHVRCRLQAVAPGQADTLAWRGYGGSDHVVLRDADGTLAFLGTAAFGPPCEPKGFLSNDHDRSMAVAVDAQTGAMVSLGEPKDGCGPLFEW